jgi:hypothetical protein
MAVKKEKIEKEDEVVDSSKQLSSFLNKHKEDHYNFEETHNYKTPCSSLLLTTVLAGGLGPGAHRFLGLASGGKSSCALDFMYHFLKEGGKRRGVYIKSEGRLGEEIQKRSGVKFVTSPEDFEDGTCFIFESNIYEAVFGLKRELINNNPDKIEYFFITDSADSLIKRDDAKKAEEDSITVGGGSLITSVFLKKVGLSMAKRGHIDIYISQIRDQIKLNPYDKTPPKQGGASGARSLEHQADVVIEFLPRFQTDLIFEGEKGSKILGHFAKCRILKSNNEKNLIEVKYPIKYGQVGGKSVWLSYELVDLIIMWELVKKAASWFMINEDLIADVKRDLNKDIPAKIQGKTGLTELLEADEELQKYLFYKFQKLID